MFGSFFLAGFECSTGWNMHHKWIDQMAATQHDVCVDEDYSRLKDIGILAAREGIRWPLVDQDGSYDFSSLDPFLDASRQHGIQLIYDLFHFGYPDGLDLFSDAFPGRFASYCHAVASYICSRVPGPYYFTPVNEPSYFSWAAGEVGRFAPHQHARGRDLKICLIRAAITGINAIWDVCPKARIVNADALCRVVPPVNSSNYDEDVEDFNNIAVFESWDMLSGKLMPELGGSKDHLDIVGVNYYWTNQWEINQGGVPLADDDPRRMPLHLLIESVWKRYQNDLLITETSHVGDQRSGWIREVAREAEILFDRGLPLFGVCLYPILGMPEWHARDVWTQMGLWDLVLEGEQLKRIINEPMLAALQEAQNLHERAVKLFKQRRKIS